ncbi:sporulation integral membrane protein YtvI [Alteribacillus persepolensis]|uniref:Sporulation integral membrane protein YtvI n=1 Tax=Alteribacillus persepolensis TaxID=568899 RepID=A0A1G7YC11_9BACI|nr:sporulation integral membrane protein YtvI [Alteribacillus persepolensis]SDG93839.1 sporulation integral membrane protein YtvI [Alteribacillus persepolensis]
MSSILNKKILLRIIAIVLILVAAYYILPVSGPIILALLTALFLSPAVRFVMDKTRVKRSIAVTLVFTLFLCILGVSGYILITQVVTQVVYLAENLPAYISDLNRTWLNLQYKIEAAYEEWDLPPEVIHEINNQITEMLTNLRDQISSGDLINEITGMVTAIPSYLVSFLVYLIALFLFLIELPRLKKQMYGFMKEDTAEKFKFMTSRLSYVILGFFKAQFLVSIIIFIVTIIGLYIFTPDVAIIMSIIIWLIDFIPIIGSIAVLAPWSLYYFISGNLVTGTQLLILAAVLLIIRRTVEPKVMGHHIGLSPLATLISLYIGLTLFGIIGFIIGPLAVIAFTSAKEAGIIKLNFKV